MKPRLFAIAASAVLAMTAAAGALWYTTPQLAARLGLPAPESPGTPSPGGSAVATGVKVGGSFKLVDHTGTTVTNEDYRGHFMLIYFGYTFCPDVCPTALAKMAAALDRLDEAELAQVQPLFITVDPARDTVERMASYADKFHPKLVGLTGTEEQVAEVADAYRVYYSKVEQEDADYYLMDHSSFVYLMGPDGDLRELMSHNTSPAEIARLIRKHVGGRTPSA